MMTYLIIRKKKIIFPLKQHACFFLQGSLNFSINYMLSYYSETFIKSGVLAVVFTSMVYMNIIFSRFFYGKKISSSTIIGSILGGLGILLLFGHDLFQISEKKEFFGLGLGLCAAISASLGNMVALKNIQSNVPISSANAFGMMYGSLLTSICVFISNEKINFHFSTKFVISLLYLAIFGTIIAFSCYNKLLKTIGPEKAAYTTIISPILAILLSSLFENLKLSAYGLFGITLCLLGNYLVLKKASFNLTKIFKDFNESTRKLPLR